MASFYKLPLYGKLYTTENIAIRTLTGNVNKCSWESFPPFTLNGFNKDDVIPRMIEKLNDSFISDSNLIATWISNK